MRYMVIETFIHGPTPVYERLGQHGRLLTPGLEFVASWVSCDGRTCYQVMECDDRSALDEWISRWHDLVEFEIVAVIPGAEAAQLYKK